MKAKLSLLAVFVFLLSTAWVSPENPGTTNNKTVAISKALNPSFSFIRAHRMSSSVVATWGLTSTEGVLSFSVQKTYEDPTDPYAFWEELCNMPCIPNRSFKHTDTNVFPGYINYRVIANMDNGSTVVSETVTVRIVSR